MPDWLESLSKIVPVERVYDDAVSPFAKQVGSLGGEVGKTARLILAPIQLAAYAQDRLEAMLKRMATRVPEERQIEVRPEISAPALEALRYLDEEGELWQLLEEILTKALDRETVQFVHPAFIQIAKQLTPDEIRILFRLAESHIEYVDNMDLDVDERTFTNRKIVSSGLDIELIFPSQFNLFTVHLQALGLIIWPIYKQEPIRNQQGRQSGVMRQSRIELTEFGKMFVEAGKRRTTINAG